MEKTASTAIHLCFGLWNSKINGQDNGSIVIPFPPDPNTGIFSGTHFVPNGTGGFYRLDIQGTCQHPGAGGAGAHFMEFQETDSNRQMLVYSGVIVPDASIARRHKIPHGKREHLFIDVGVRRVEVTAEDDWTAEKVT
ncbi:MAG: hypothetical protein ACREA9_04795 [Pyrinomonadaceae bacterium]